MRSRWRIVTAMALTLASLLAATGPAAAHGGPRVRTLADGFELPLGLAVTKDGTVYVASAAGLTKLRRGDQRLVYEQEGSSFAGVDVNRKGKVVFTETIGQAGPEMPATETTLNLLKRKGDARVLASLLEFEQRENPDGDQMYGLLDTDEECLARLPEDAQPYSGQVDSNPYAVATTRKGDYLVADAGGNTIVRVSAKGRKVSTVAVLPPIPQEITQDVLDQFAAEGIELDECVLGETYYGEPVPTDVEIGRDGRYYVSVLPGFPEAPGAGAVFRISPRSGRMKQVASGFDGAVDIALDRKGTIYVAEIFGDRISKVRKGEVSTFVEVPAPGAVEVARNGKIYATTDVFSPNGAVVVIKKR